MTKLHIAQEPQGYWMLSLEHPDGRLELLANHFLAPDHLINEAREMAAEGGDYEGAVILLDPPRRAPASVSAGSCPPEEYQEPEPRRAGE